ncbi:flagellar protein FliJ [Cellvibrio zantedeschiae]|uniref:Flagellar FliJ protein n=1 Tax=Cellvibrio zantedeschiae TaxID=1237077 RepID=A0ABQ3AYK2_9GAMM|nr:flagellar export protein FliJ [Cellvibrio zantedeschiae]GGY68387.1 flagellar protein FliJ [Cellvibrio zantedeschiae]
MAESRAKRMQVVLTLAERAEEQAGQQLSQCQAQVDAETEQLRQLDEYAAQYLTIYTERKTAVRPQELIAYSGFIQRLGDARKEQEGRLKRIEAQMERLRQAWRIAHQKCESIKELITRLKQEENALLDKRLQKELDELVGQAYIRRENID